MGLSSELSCESGSFSHCYLNPHRCFQSMWFNQCGLRLYFHVLEPWVVWSVVGSTSCCLVCPAPQSTASLGPPAAVLLRVLSPISSGLPISTPPSSLDECVFFNSLVVGLPYSSIFVSSGCFLFLNCCSSFGCVYLCFHLGRKSLDFL